MPYVEVTDEEAEAIEEERNRQWRIAVAASVAEPVSPDASLGDLMAWIEQHPDAISCGLLLIGWEEDWRQPHHWSKHCRPCPSEPHGTWCVHWDHFDGCSPARPTLREGLFDAIDALRRGWIADGADAEAEGAEGEDE